MTGRQGRIAVAAAVVIITLLLLRSATATGNWAGFVVTEIGMLVPLGISWWILGRPTS